MAARYNSEPKPAITHAKPTELAVSQLIEKYPKLVREKLDFKDCPDEELLECWLYEFKSESPYARQEILAWRETCNAKTFDALLWVARTLTWAKYGQQFYALWPEWPDGPYLSVLPAERKRRLKLLFPDKTESRTAKLTPSPAVPGKLSQAEVDFMLELLGQSEVEYVRIDLRKSTRSILSELALWIKWQKTNRKCKAKPNVLHRTLRTDLKVLGAHRILEATGGDWGNAPPIYRYQSEWIKADARAMRIIKKIDSL